MLSDDALDKLMQPIIDRQEAINNFVLEVIANRVKQIGTLLPSDVYKLITLYERGADVKKINAELAWLTGLQIQDIKRLIKQAALNSYQDAKPYYDYRHKPFIPFNENVALQRVVSTIAQTTADTYINMSKAQAFMIRDLKNPKVLKPTPIAQTYQTVVDEAIQASQSGTIDYNTAMYRTLKQLNDSGIRYVTYQAESGRVHTQRLDTAVRRNLMDGIRAINQGVQDEVGKQFGADGKEITVHANSAPDHEPVQGHQFSNEEFAKLQDGKPFKDYAGQKFGAIERAIGTLNCRHFTYSIVLGVTKPNYTPEQLEEFIRKNNEGYTTPDGKHMTMYECTQYQRKLETEVRKAKDGQMMAKAAGNMKLVDYYQARITKCTNQYKAFSQACGLSPKMTKMRVSGYRRISTKNSQ